MTTRANRIVRYYDSHEIEGEEVTQSILHYAIIKYLISLLEELFAQMLVGVISNINFYQTDNPNEQPTSPDVAVIDGFRIEFGREEGPTSYYVGQDGPPPRLVFEISSGDTWRIDLRDKPAQYAIMGVREYFAFDPNLRTLWTRQWKAKGRLIGWRLGADGQYVELEKDPNERLWSEEMQSWLVVEGNFIGAYTAEGQRRLTKEQAAEQRTRLSDQQAALERQARRAEQQRREAAEQQALVERQRAETERQQREAAEQAAERERRRAEKLAELIRLNGIKLDEEF